MKRRGRAWVDTPKAGPVRVTNLSTGETHTEPPLSFAERKQLAKRQRTNEKILSYESYRENAERRPG